MPLSVTAAKGLAVVALMRALDAVVKVLGADSETLALLAVM